MGVVVRRYIDLLILPIPTPLFYSAASLFFVHIKIKKLILVPVLFGNCKQSELSGLFNGMDFL